MPSEPAERRAALISAVLVSFFTPFMASSVNIALPSIGREFALDAILLSWVATSYLLSSAVALLPMGRLADIRGRKRIFLWGVSVYSAASLLLGFVDTATALIALRVVQGIGAAMMFGPSTAILTSVFPPERRGHALGISIAAVYLGLSLGPFFGGMIIEHLGWRALFWSNAPLALVVVPYTLRNLKSEWRDARGEGFDTTGTVIYSATLVALMYGFSQLPRVTGALLLAAGVIGAALFLWWETRPAHPLLDVRLFRGNRAFIFSNIAALINYSATFAVTFLLSLYLQYLKAMTPQQAGLVLVAQPAMMTIFAPLSGRLSDRIEPRVLSSWGMALTAIGLSLFVFLNEAMPLAVIIGGLVVLGIGFGLFSSPNTNAVMSAVERRHYGVASAVLGTMRLVGQMFNMGLVMLIFAVVIGRVQITPDKYSAFQHAARVLFAISAVLCALGVFISLARGKRDTGGPGIAAK